MNLKLNQSKSLIDMSKNTNMPTKDRFIRPNIEPRYPTMTENSFKKDIKKYAALSSAVILAYMKKELKEISKDRPITAAEMTALLTSVSKLNNKLETENESSLSLVRLRNKLKSIVLFSIENSTKVKQNI